MSKARIHNIGPGFYRLDLRGYVCPYPQVFTLKALSELKRGEILEVIIDNPASCENVPSAVSSKGHKILGIDKIGAGIWRILIERG